MVAMKHIELAQRNCTYWIAAADPDAAFQALTGVVDDVSQIALMTDGAARAVSFGLMTWVDLFELLKNRGPAELIARVRSAEASDPRGIRWPRNKHSDDATIVSLAPGPQDTRQAPVP